MNLLLSAFACRPGLGSEPGIGWNLALHLARHHSVTVLTDGGNRADILRHQREHRAIPLTFGYVSLPRPFRNAAHGIGLHHLYYLLWQFLALRRALRLHTSQPFDLVHHVTYVNSWLPSLMGYLGIGFVWSAGQRDTTPAAFLPGMSWRGRFSEVSRNMATRSLSVPTQILTARMAKLILTSSRDATWPEVSRVEYFPLGGLSAGEIDRLGRIPIRHRRRFRVVSIGRLLGLKGFFMGISAFQQIREELPDSEYWIVGAGPERNYLDSLIQRLGLGESVRLLGAMDREGVFQVLEHTDVLVHPSLHEQFGYVVVEAMAAGRPAICLDVGPFPAVVGEEGGFLIPRSRPAQVIEQLAARLIELGRNRERLAQAGGAARARAAQQWSWEAVTERLTRLYSEIQ